MTELPPPLNPLKTLDCMYIIFTGRSEVVGNRTTTRPGLDFSSKFFTRYGDLEKEAVAAFDFLNDVSTPVSSPELQDCLSNKEVERTPVDASQSVDGRGIQSHCQLSNVGLDKYVPKDIKIDQISTDKQLREQISNVKAGRPFLRGLSLDQSVSSTDSNLSPVKKNRRKLRPKIKKDQQSNSKRAMRQGMKFSSTSADESFDDLSFSDSCCYHSFSSSSESLDSSVAAV